MNKSFKAYLGSCHCGNSTYRFHSQKKPEEWKVRRCGCSFCISYSTHLYGSDPNGCVGFEHKNQNLLNIYNHGTETADFLVCGACNAFLGAIMMVDEKQRFAVLNLEHLVEKHPLSEPYNLKWAKEEPILRKRRRLSNWTPVVNQNEEEI